MGYTSYNLQSRSVRADSLGYKTKSVDDLFEQKRKRDIHESMEPSKALLREARDSETHPLSVPIILALDETGSMGKIPEYLVREGLPHMMSNIIERGVPDPSVLFLAIGDHKSDRHFLQVGQFESGDEELDTWLTRMYPEGNGGGNGGESYSLAWYYAANHTSTDSFEKRGKKGFLFTVGDEPCHQTIPASAIKELMGENPERSFSDVELLTAAQKMYNVYHLHIMEGYTGYRSLSYWKELLGENCVEVEDYRNVHKIIAQIVVDNTETSNPTKKPGKIVITEKETVTTKPTADDDMFL